jgi:hypothetical protein
MSTLRVFPVILFLLVTTVFAESSQNAVSGGSTEAPLPASVVTQPEAKVKKIHSSKGKVTREKEAEGTQAPKRFDTDIVIKSQYQLNGQALEVDTD